MRSMRGCLEVTAQGENLSGGWPPWSWWEGGPSTCQDSHLAGKRGASQGSPLRVAPGVPLGMGGDSRTIMRSTYILVGLDTYVSDAVSSSCPTWTSPRGAAMSAPHSRGEHRPATLRLLFTVLWGWWSPQNHHTDHRGRAAHAATAEPTGGFELDLRYL